MAVRILFFGFFGGNLTVNLLFYSPTYQSSVNQYLNKLISPYFNTELSITEAKGMASDTLVSSFFRTVCPPDAAC